MLRTMVFAMALMVALGAYAQRLVTTEEMARGLFEPEEAKPLLVMLDAQFEGGDTQSGAGIIFERKAGRVYIATANHVVRRGPRSASAVRVSFHWVPGETFEGRLADSSDAQLDLAVVIVDAGVPAPGKGWRSLPVLDTWETELKRRDEVYAMGYSNGRKWFVRAKPDEVRSVSAGVIEFDADYLGPGYSGGGLFDRDGGFLGMIRRDNPPTGEAIAQERLVGRLADWGYTPQFSN